MSGLESMMVKGKNKLIKVEQIIERYFFHLLLLILLILTIVIFWDFESRLFFQSDTTRDISIAKEAIERRQIPLVGSFSSAGPFVFGPAFYWFLVSVYLIFPNAIISPWIATAIIGILTVIMFAYLGYLLGGKKLSLILAILTATSAELIHRSASLTQHTYVIILSLLAIIFLVLFWQKKK